MTTERRPSGWLWFAGVVLIVAGTFNVLHGITALHNSSYLVHKILYTNLTFWGWVFLIWGVLQMLAGLLALGGRMSGSYIGVFLAGIGAALWFFMIFAAPFAALLGVTINVMVIYGLTVGAEE